MSKKELLFSVTKKDLNISHFSGSGAGGQNRNRHKNCIRLHHPDSDTHVTGQSHKEERSNMKEALTNLTTHHRFKAWHKQRTQELLSGITLEELVDKAMRPDNIKIEVRNEEGKWVEE